MISTLILRYWQSFNNTDLHKMMSFACSIQKKTYTVSTHKPGTHIKGSTCKFAEIDNEFLKKLHSHGWLGISSNVHALISFAHLFLQVIITANLMFWNPTTTMHCGACGVESAAKDLKLNVKCCEYVTISKTYNFIFGLAWANEWDTCGAPSINMIKNNLNLNRNHIEESRYELEKTNDPYVFTTGIFYVNSR